MEEYNDLLDFEYYTEIATNLIYEVKLFENFVIARPASPAFYEAIRKMDLNTFSKEFAEYAGDSTKLREELRDVQEFVTLEQE